LNEVAIHAGHEIAINIDSDRYVEPAAIQAVFKHHLKLTVKFGHRCFIDATQKLEQRRNPFLLQFEPYTVTENGLYTPRIFWLFGAMYAWNPQYLDRIGGMKHTLIEDITLALEAHLDGIHTQHVAAAIWGYTPSTLMDIVNARIRLYQGYLQLKELTQNSKASLLPLNRMIR
jgi:cellulose synthase/poly-beta-1,6-N-acetylglucosamine synthase-like glycosyltransferase